MVKKIRLLAFCCMIGLSTAVLAGPGEDIKGGALVEVALQDAIASGMTIDEAVADAIAQNLELSGDIVAAAFGILDTLPDSACAAPAEEGAEPVVDREGCGDRITQAAILAGADPGEVTAAAAAGVTGGPGGPGTPPGPGDGNRGGNIASPS